MEIITYHSHFNGLEHLLVHKPEIWREVEDAVTSVDAEACRKKTAVRGFSNGKASYSTVAMCKAINFAFETLGWASFRTNSWVIEDGNEDLNQEKSLGSDNTDVIEEPDLRPIISYNQTDLIKDKVAVEVQFGKYSFIAYDLFVKHLAFYMGDKIDIGIEILPMKELQKEMSSGVGYYESGLYDLIREGRGVPAVPLVLVGISP